MAETLTFGPSATVSDAAVTVLAANESVVFEGLGIYNRCDNDGWFSVDSGDNWRLMPAQSFRTVKENIDNQTIQIKRVAGGSNLSGVIGEISPDANFALLTAATATLGDVGLLNKLDVAVNPATEDKQTTINTTLGTVKTSVDAVTTKLSADPATETTLGTVKTAVDAVATVLNAPAQAGEIDAAITALNLMSGEGLTFFRVIISTAGTQELLAKVGSQYQRLHGIQITCSAMATIDIEDKDSGAVSTWFFGANGGICIPYNADKRGTIQAVAVNKGLQIVTSAGTVSGFAIVSTGV